MSVQAKFENGARAAADSTRAAADSTVSELNRIVTPSGSIDLLSARKAGE